MSSTGFLTPVLSVIYEAPKCRACRAGLGFGSLIANLMLESSSVYGGSL